jgi:DNA polymerase III subunit beta
MRFTVARDAFAEAVAWVARALPSRPVIPVLAGLLLQADGDGLTLACFDYEVSARMTVPAEVAEPGTALVPGRLLVEITRSLPALPVHWWDDPDGVSMTCGEASFTLVPLPREEYPDLPDVPHVAGTVDGGAFGTAIGQVTPAASRDDTLPMLTAVSLELAGATMTLAATDRYRLAVRDLGWEPAGEHGPHTLLVPARTLADAARMMHPGQPVRVMLRDGEADDGGDAMIGFEAGDRRLTTRLLAGEFVKYRSRFPAEFSCVADLPAEAFTEALRRVSLVAERGTPVQLSFGPGKVTVIAATQGQARARESVPAWFSGDEPVIAFNPHYLLDGMVAATAGATGAAPAPGAAAEDETAADQQAGPARVRLQFSSPSKPAVITASPTATEAEPTASAGEATSAEETASADGSASADDKDGARPGAFRYLVVPQRVSQ